VSQIRTRIGWPLFFVFVIGAAAAVIYFFAFAQYASPRSRLYATSLGYPALMRALGRPIPVEVATAQVRPITDVVSAVGSVDYLDTVPIETEMAGIVVGVPVRDGDHVEPGDVLAWVSTGGQEARAARLDLDMKRAAFDKAKGDFDRNGQAYKRGIIAQAAFDASAAAYHEADINMKLAEETLANTLRSRTEKIMTAAALDPQGARAMPVATGGALKPQTNLDPRPDVAASLTGFGERTPILALTTGTVLQVRTFVGDNLTTPAIRLMSMGSRLIFNASVDQRYFGSVHVGDKTQIFVRALDGTVLEGRAIRINPTVARPGGAGTQTVAAMPSTYPVAVEFIPAGQKLPPLAAGMDGYCIFTYEADRLTIPEAALMRYSGGDGVVAVVDKDDRVQVVQVNYSVNAGGWVAITNGLPRGARVILGGQTALRPGDKVSVR
jgi:multidrug efflux pump subunit AcrA (membrane-fusion protein)